MLERMRVHGGVCAPFGEQPHPRGVFVRLVQRVGLMRGRELIPVLERALDARDDVARGIKLTRKRLGGAQCIPGAAIKGPHALFKVHKVCAGGVRAEPRVVEDASVSRQAVARPQILQDEPVKL